MKLPGVAVATLCVVVSSTVSSLATAGYKGPPLKQEIPVTCDKDVKGAEITLPNSVVTVTCTTADQMNPQVTDGQTATKVCGDQACEKADVVIGTLCPGATIKGGTGNKVAIITIPQLPTTKQVFYMQCKQSGTELKCTAKITVSAAAAQGPQSCAVGNDSVSLQVQQDGGKAHFACGDELSLYPTEDTKALTADCLKEESVKDLTRRIITPGNYVELTATKKGKKSLCYLCRTKADMDKKDQVTNNDCKVLVQVSGSTPLLHRLAFGLTLPCVLTLLHLAP